MTGKNYRRTGTMYLTDMLAAISLACVLLIGITSDVEARRHRHGDGRPGAWCGWFMSHHVFGKNIRNLWLARNWARIGSPAHGPAPGVIGVQAHHVFKVVKVVAPGRVLAISGNDGNAVKTRVRSTSRVIAWRRV